VVHVEEVMILVVLWAEVLVVVLLLLEVHPAVLAAVVLVEENPLLLALPVAPQLQVVHLVAVLQVVVRPEVEHPSVVVVHREQRLVVPWGAHRQEVDRAWGEEEVIGQVVRLR